MNLVVRGITWVEHGKRNLRNDDIKDDAAFIQVKPNFRSIKPLFKKRINLDVDIVALCKRGRLKEAVHQLYYKNGPTDCATYAFLLQECGKLMALSEGMRVHSHIVESKCGQHTFLANHLIAMYGKCHALQEACEVFDTISRKNLFSWSAIITVYAQNFDAKGALHLFEDMLIEGDMPDKVIFLAIIKACSSSGSLPRGKLIHARTTRTCFVTDVFITSALVNMYGKNGALISACILFFNIHRWNAISWNTMISMFAEHGQGRKALEFFHEMRLQGTNPTHVTFISVLDACARLDALAMGSLIHSCVLVDRLESDIIVATALVNMYGKCGDLRSCHGVADKMHAWDLIMWNALIWAHSQQNYEKEEALWLFWNMHSNRCRPDEFTFVGILSACTSPSSLAVGKLIHAYLFICGLETQTIVGTSLVNMYNNCGDLEYARAAFDKICKKDMVSWNAIVLAYTKYGQGENALDLFEQMQMQGMNPDEVTIATMLDLCGDLGAQSKGNLIYSYIGTKEFDVDDIIGSALVKMYSKCGSLRECRMVFNEMNQPDLVSWSALIGAYAQHSHVDDALELFQQMHQQGIRPDGVSFLAVLTACSHSGLLDDGYHNFIFMVGDNEIVPILDHYGCIVDQLGRAGYLDEAEQLVSSMPFSNSAIERATLATACKMYGHMHLDMLLQVGG